MGWRWRLYWLFWNKVWASPDGCYLYVDGNLVYSVKDGLVSSHNQLDDGQ